MSTKAQVITQAKPSAIPGPAHAGQSPLVMSERESERPDIATQLASAARLGHSLEAIRVNSAAPSQIQAQPLIQRQPVPEGEEDEEELQMQRESADIQRQELPEEEQEEELQMMSAIPRMGLEGGPVAPEVEAAIQRARGGGQPLDRAIQAQMGETLGHDFSDVRIHTGAQADALNQQLNARAFTTGRDLFFSHGAYEPDSGSGRELIAHELSHVVQQDTGVLKGNRDGMIVRPADDALEQEADLLAYHAESQHAVTNAERAEPTELREIWRGYYANAIQRNDKQPKKLTEQETDSSHKLGRILGTAAAWTSVIPIAGPIIAGFLTTSGQFADWRHEVAQTRESKEADIRHEKEIVEIKKDVKTIDYRVMKLESPEFKEQAEAHEAWQRGEII
jgi:hypothetical protein